MVITTISPSNYYNCLEPGPVQTYSILKTILPVTPISEDGIIDLFYESYSFWTDPECTITHEDIANSYLFQLDEEFKYTIRSESLSEKWYTSETSKQDTGFSIPSVWGRNQR